MMPVTPTLAAQLNQQAARQRQAQLQQQQQRPPSSQQQQQQQDGRKGGKAPAPPAAQEDEQQQQAAAAAALASGGQIHYIPEGGAVVVVAVLPGSPAQKAGLQNLDVLLSIDKRPIFRVEDAQQMIQAAGVGTDLEVKVLRRTQEVTLRVRTTDFLTLFRRQQANRRYPELKRNGGRVGAGEEGGVEEQRQRRGMEEEDGDEGDGGGNVEEDVMGGLSRHQHATKGEEGPGKGRVGEAEGAEEGEEGAAGEREDRACSRADGLRGHLYC